MMPNAATRGRLALRWATILEATTDAGVDAPTRGHVLAFDTEPADDQTAAGGSLSVSFNGGHC